MLDRKHNAIFIHVPKTGGQSVESVFLELHGLSWENRAPLLLGPKEECVSGSDADPVILTHLLAREYVENNHIDQKGFDEHFKFAIFRNPWSRMVSEYRYRKDFPGSFEKFVEGRLKLTDLRKDTTRHIVPQMDFVIDQDGAVIVDFIGRFEELQSDFAIIAERLRLESRTLPHQNKSGAQKRPQSRLKRLTSLFGKAKPKPFQEYYTPALRDRLGEFYSRDIEFFGYTFEGDVSSEPFSLASA